MSNSNTRGTNAMRTSLRHKLTPARRWQRVHVPALLHAHSHIMPHITRVAYGLRARAVWPYVRTADAPAPYGRPMPALQTPLPGRHDPVRLPCATCAPALLAVAQEHHGRPALPSYLLRPDDPTLLTRRAAPYHSLLPLRSRLREPFASASEITTKAAVPFTSDMVLCRTHRR